MKRPSLIVLGAALCATGLLSLTAQQPVLPPAASVPSLNPDTSPQSSTPQVRRRVVLGTPGSEDSQRAPLIALLSRNYLLRISVTEGDKVTEYKLVTAASAISISTPGSAEGVRSASINGQMEESEEGQIGVALVVSVSVPEPAPVQPGAPIPPGRGQSHSEAFSASLRAKLGVEYPIFTTAARTYKLTISPHEEQEAVPAK